MIHDTDDTAMIHDVLQSVCMALYGSLQVHWAFLGYFGFNASPVCLARWFLQPI